MSCSLKKHPIPLLSIIFLLLVLQPCISTDILTPLLSPFFDELCKDIPCGKGKCKTGTNYTLGYACECDQGWKQIPSNDDDDRQHLGFLPCVIPNCTVDYSCTNAEAPTPQLKDPPKNGSFFDVCNWAYCGEGSCKKSTNSGYNCECQQGSANLLNTTTFPCFTECSIGGDCKDLGLTLTNRTSASPPALRENSDNYASSVLPGKIFWVMVLMFTTISATTWI